MGSKCIIVFGVSGSGKSTIGKLLAKKLSVPFFEADDFHPRENIAKLTTGHALTDNDRIPWLKTLNQEISKAKKTGFVLSCSALKESYRQILATNVDGIDWVLLDGSFELIHQRITERKNHFMNPKLLRDQFNTLEIPDYGNKYSIDYPPKEIVQKILIQIIG